MPAANIADRLLAGSIPEPNGGCWIWLLGLDTGGYGVISVKNKTQLAHRVAFETFVGPIPSDRLVRHRCDVRCCVNPDHLLSGTYKDNADDAVSRGRWLTGEDHPRVKFTDQQVAEIRSRVAAGEAGSTVARDFKTSTSYVSLVARGKLRAVRS